MGLTDLVGLKMVAGYEKTVDALGKEYRGVELFSRDHFLKSLRAFVDATRLEPLCWDSRWINPVQIVSHGLRYALCEDTVVTLRCDQCEQTLSLDLVDSQWNESYAKHLAAMHTRACPWAHRQIPLDLVYAVNSFTIGFEIDEIRKQLSVFKNLQITAPADVCDKIRELSHAFEAEVNLGLFYILVKGYFVCGDNGDGDIALQSRGSFINASLDDVLHDPEFNGHPNWSSHYDQEHVMHLLFQTMFHGSGDLEVNDRLAYLRKLISD